MPVTFVDSTQKEMFIMLYIVGLTVVFIALQPKGKFCNIIILLYDIKSIIIIYISGFPPISYWCIIYCIIQRS